MLECLWSEWQKPEKSIIYPAKFVAENEAMHVARALQLCISIEPSPSSPLHCWQPSDWGSCHRRSSCMHQNRKSTKFPPSFSASASSVCFFICMDGISQSGIGGLWTMKKNKQKTLPYWSHANKGTQFRLTDWGCSTCLCLNSSFPWTFHRQAITSWLSPVCKTVVWMLSLFCFQVRQLLLQPQRKIVRLPDRR